MKGQDDGEQGEEKQTNQSLRLISVRIGFPVNRKTDEAKVPLPQRLPRGGASRFVLFTISAVNFISEETRWVNIRLILLCCKVVSRQILVLIPGSY